MELERRGLNKTEEERNAMIPELRKFSRQEYLKKREVQKLEELKGMIEDEEYLFDGVELTEQEVKDQEYRKKIYKLAMEQVRNVDEILDDRYKMPDSYDEGGKQGADKRFEALTAWYRDTQDADDTNPFKEQEEWESHQITMSKAQFGALDKKPAGKQYDYVFEDQIGFIKDEVMGGVGDVSSSSSDDETDDEDGNRVKKAKQRQKSARELAEVRPRIRSRLQFPSLFRNPRGFLWRSRAVSQPAVPLVRHPIFEPRAVFHVFLHPSGVAATSIIERDSCPILSSNRQPSSRTQNRHD